MATSNMNSYNGIGNLVKDCTFKDFGNGVGVVEMTIAVNRTVKHGDKWESEASFFDVKYISKGAKSISAYLVKGTKIAVNGELVQERWEKDGKKSSAIKIYAKNIWLLSSSSKSENHSSDEDSQEEFNYSADNFPEEIPF